MYFSTPRMEVGHEVKQHPCPFYAASPSMPLLHLLYSGNSLGVGHIPWMKLLYFPILVLGKLNTRSDV